MGGQERHFISRNGGAAHLPQKGQAARRTGRAKWQRIGATSTSCSRVTRRQAVRLRGTQEDRWCSASGVRPCDGDVRATSRTAHFSWLCVTSVLLTVRSWAISTRSLTLDASWTNALVRKVRHFLGELSRGVENSVAFDQAIAEEPPRVRRPDEI